MNRRSLLNESAVHAFIKDHPTFRVRGFERVSAHYTRALSLYVEQIIARDLHETGKTGKTFRARCED